MNWLMNTGSEKWSKMICSHCEEERKIKVLHLHMILHHCVCYIFPRLVCMHLGHFLSGQVLRGLLLLWRIHHQVSGEQLQS